MSDHRWCPDKCPITGRAFFCWIEDEDGSQVPTYGGPFDSYTLPERDEHGEFTVKHYDHDLGGWRDYMSLGVRLIDDQREDNEWGTVEALQARIAEQDAAIALMRGQSDIFAAVRMLLDSAPAHMTPRNAKEREAYKLLRALTGVCNCPGGSKPAQFHAPNCPAREVTKETT